MTKILVALAALTAISVPSAKAEIEYPWCAYYGPTGSSGTNCGFTTVRQCQATVSGIGGYCGRNPRYHGRARH
ncbi:MAG TPA: DUF3551 domain-containing protein [Pseudolabrys sp.]|nr:DUF3551 domain-containing protein [Pseudolabrys sp.]